MLHRRLLLVLLVATLTSAATHTEERVALRVAIAGVPLSPNLQPRIAVDLQRDGGETRVEIRGLAAVAYAGAIATGDPLEVTAVTHDGRVTRMFNGIVNRVSQGSRDGYPLVEIGATGRDETEPSPVPFPIGGNSSTALLAFAPRLSASFSLQQVVVRAFDVAGAPLTATATAPTIPLGDETRALFGQVIEIASDRAFVTQAEADAFAAATLAGRLEARVSGEAVIEGDPGISPGRFVELQGLDVEFDGAYYVAGVSHRFGHESYGGFASTLRLRRSDLGMFRLPEIDDEVLVGFEHGDLNRPFRLESWWTCDSRPRSSDGGSDQCRYLRWPW
jgi:hypothetical protein